MQSPILSPIEWTLPDPTWVFEKWRTIRAPKEPGIAPRNWAFSRAIAPVTLYAYLKYRFGIPNGPMMITRTPSVDDFIYWHYALECRGELVNIMGLSGRLEIVAQTRPIDTSGWQALEANLREEFTRHGESLARIRASFEHWRLFLNPFRRLALIATRHEDRLKQIDITTVPSLPIPATQTQSRAYSADLKNAMERYQEAMALCVELEMIAPVMGEAAVNLVLLLLAKPEVKNDERLRDKFSRDPIDVRIKSLHLVCDGISRPIDGSEEPFKAFLRIMNRRNDALHGNIDPRRSSGEEIFFDDPYIPLLAENRSFNEAALANALVNLSPERSIRDLREVRDFVDFLVGRMDPGAQEAVRRAMEEQQLGYRAETGEIGIVLPSVQMDFLPLSTDEETKGSSG